MNVTELTNHERTQRQVRLEIAEAALSQSAAARQIGVSPATLQLWLGNTYKGNIGNVDRKAEAWLTRRSEAAALSTDAAGLDVHRDLVVTDHIVATLTHAQAHGDIAVVHGPSGAGKTSAARHYAETRAGVFMARMTGVVRSMPAMLRIIARAVEAAPLDRSAAAAETAVIERLSGRDALLIIDEAHHLGARLIDELRCIRDLAGCGVALIGDDALVMTLQRCPQVLGRTCQSVHARPPGEGDIAALIGPILGREANAAEIRTCLAIVQGPGGLHTLRRALQAAWMEARLENSADVDVGAHLSGAAQALDLRSKEATA